MRSNWLLLPLALAIGAPAFGQGSLGSEIAHVVLVKDCTDAGWDAGDVGTKCFESVSSLQDYIWGTSGIFPSASDPLTVDIGPGEFSGSLECVSGEGWVTFRGAGRDRSVIKATGSSLVSTFRSHGCSSIAFEHVKLVADSSVEAGYAVLWTEGGSSNWTDVELEGDGSGWYDHSCEGEADDAPEGKHYFWGSAVRGGKYGYLAECGETWFYGGEIAAQSAIRGSFANHTAGVFVVKQGEVHTNGSAIRVSTAGVESGSGTVYGVRVGTPANFQVGLGYGEFHSHGGLISVRASNLSGVAAIGVSMNDDSGSGDAKAHTHETAFVVNGGSSSTRLSGTGTFESPFQWEARTSPPAAGGAIDGMDMYVETDCDSSACSSGSSPHLMIYDPDCSTSPWFDTVRGACRN